MKRATWNQRLLVFSRQLGIFLFYLVFLNLLLFIFNLIPIPPLDGYRIIQDLAPLHIRYKMDQNVQWGLFVFLLLVLIPPLRSMTIDPLLSWRIDIFIFFDNLFSHIFHPVDWSKLWNDYFNFKSL